MEIPYYQKVRNCIDELGKTNDDVAMFCRALYLFGVRSSELVGFRSPKDISPKDILGPRGKDAKPKKVELLKQENVETTVTDYYRNVKEKHPDEHSDFEKHSENVIVFKLKFEAGRTRRIESELHQVALPLSKEIEPWTQKLYGYYTRGGSNDFVFKCTRMTPTQYVRDHQIFKKAGLTYPVE